MRNGIHNHLPENLYGWTIDGERKSSIKWGMTKSTNVDIII